MLPDTKNLIPRWLKFMGSESLHSPTKYLMGFLHQLYSHADFITENYAAVLKKKSIYSIFV